MAVTGPTKRVVAFRSGGICGFPSCVRPLVESATTANPAIPVGEAAHIAGERPAAARYDIGMSSQQRDAADNLLYLCPNHHTIIDGQPETYTREWLISAKQEHEERVWVSVRQAKIVAMSAIGFDELDVVVRTLATSEPFVNPSLTLTMPEQKLSRNGLGSRTRSKIVLGLVKSMEIEQFLNSPSARAEGWANRIAARFRSEYDTYLADGLLGDELFDALEAFAIAGRPDALHEAAGLAVVVYLFEKCDLFDP